MAYTGSGRLPMERASKIGHIKIIQDPRIQRLVDAFERVHADSEDELGELSGHIDLSKVGNLENVVAVDGSHCAVPNSLHEHKQLAFIKVSTIILRRSEIEAMKANPIIDPRDLALHLETHSESMMTALPLSNVVIPGETVAESIRKIVDSTLRENRLYDTLRFLVSREWLPAYEMQEHMGCFKCGREFPIPRSILQFRCPHCREMHTLADYLSVTTGVPEDWAKEEAAISLRNIMETLALISLLRQYADHPVVLKRTLFVKDGPLLLRAQLSRLIEPIRAFLMFLKEEKQHALHIVGIEKTGELVDHVPQIRMVLNEPGDYFLPTVKYLHERIQGVPFEDSTYRNRVQYGAKVVVRLSPTHVIVANIPTGDFMACPTVDNLYGFEESMSLLSRMLSSRYENALVPLVLANSMASISMKPSGDILETFARRLLGE